MTQRLEVTFQFPIGSTVYFRTAVHDVDHEPKPFMVARHVAERCHGGYQLHYDLVGHNGLVPEIALTDVMPVFQVMNRERQDGILVWQKLQQSTSIADQLGRFMSDEKSGG